MEYWLHRSAGTLDQLPATYARFAQLRAERPVFYDEQAHLWHVFRYDDVQTVISDHARFSSKQRPDRPTPFNRTFIADTLIASDPPEHRQLRNLVNLAFTPRALAHLEARIAQITQELLDRVREQGRMDVIEEIAFPLPAKVIAELLGVPAADWDIFQRWVRGEQIAPPAGTLSREEEVTRAMRRQHMQMQDYFAALLAERRRHPRADVFSILSQAEVDGERLSEEALVSFSFLLLAAGQETTKNLIANAFILWTEQPEMQARLRREPALMPTAVEELVRYLPPALKLFRLTTTAVELSGQRIPADQVVLAWVASANRDPEQFPNPDQFDPQRSPNRHLGFGHGVHFCLGAPLARLEARTALPLILAQLHDIQRVPNIPIRIDQGLVFVVKNLPVTFK